jgi:hypothetical protein
MKSRREYDKPYQGPNERRDKPPALMHPPQPLALDDAGKAMPVRPGTKSRAAHAAAPRVN